MKPLRLFTTLFITALLLGSCANTQNEIPTLPPTPSPTITSTPTLMPTPTPLPTATPTPIPDLTVCMSGCDFTLIQEAIDADSTQNGTVIGVVDMTHTEEGILVHKNVTIQGNGALKTIVQASTSPDEATNRVFEIVLDADVTLRGMTIQYGKPTTSPLTGGGILNYGTLTTEDVIIRENYGSAGGGVYNEGTLTMWNSTISENGSIGGGDRYLECETGGGLKILTGQVTLINSTISNNRSNSKGGGVHVACYGYLVLQNSTISGNFAEESGGGIYMNGSGNFTFSTISNNSANNVGGLALNGKDTVDNMGQLTLNNTIIAGNISRLGEYGIADCDMQNHAAILDNRYNWIGDGNCEAVFSGDPHLGALEDNGGLTLNHSLLPGSPAIDMIPAESCTVETDQRGAPRLAPCDIGAFEAQTP